MDSYILLSAGGTQIRSIVLNGCGETICPMVAFDACAGESRERIIAHLYGILSNRMHDVGGHKLCGIGMVFPGPFDYEHGVSHMHGLHKYDAIEGVLIKDALLEFQALQGEQILLRADTHYLFLHDMYAFALGACAENPMLKKGKNWFVCLGTGTGSAFMRDGQWATDTDLPRNGWIYDQPFRTGRINDYLSAAGLMNMYDPMCQMKPESITALADRGDERALNAFARFALAVEQALTPYLMQYRPDRLILGGGLTNALRHFGTPLQARCDKLGIEFVHMPNMPISELRGMFSCFVDATMTVSAPHSDRVGELDRRKGATPLYGQIAELLKRQIENGEYASGDRFPSEKQLQERFSVSRMTVRQAVGEMSNAQYLKSGRGVGTRVVYRPQST